MGYRVDSCRIVMSVFVEFDGYREVDFTLPLPIAHDDPLILLALERNRELLWAAAKAAGPENTGFLG